MNWYVYWEWGSVDIFWYFLRSLSLVYYSGFSGPLLVSFVRFLIMNELFLLLLFIIIIIISISTIIIVIIKVGYICHIYMNVYICVERIICHVYDYQIFLIVAVCCRRSLVCFFGLRWCDVMWIANFYFILFYCSSDDFSDAIFSEFSWNYIECCTAVVVVMTVVMLIDKIIDNNEHGDSN